MSTILITGATGNVGSRLVHHLVDSGQTVRAMVHDPAHAVRVAREGVDLAYADFADPISLRAALDGVDRVFLACGNVPDQVASECALVDAAADSGVRRIVKLSARGAATDAPVAYWHAHAVIEEHLRASGVPAVILQPGFLMTNLLAAADHVREQGMLFAPAGEAPIAMIDPSDVAAVAAVALTSDGHEGTHVLTGPEAISYSQVAAVLTEVVGRSVGYADIPPEAAVPALVQAGLPTFAAEQVVAVFGELRAGAQSRTTRAVETLTRRAPRPFATFARDHAGAFVKDATAVGV
jgi:uncharacterized protein YbjT (DUF2867 family)